MGMSEHVRLYAPDFSFGPWNEEERYYLEPFFSNLDGYLTVMRNLPPEIAGAICARASRASGSLPSVMWNEYVKPILYGDDSKLAAELRLHVDHLHHHGFQNILNAQRAQNLYAKLLAGFGDDSVAQVTGTHVVCGGISQVLMKFFEDQRLGLEPQEQSTRFGNFGRRVNGRFRYFVPRPDLGDEVVQYQQIMDGLFEAYNEAIQRFTAWLKEAYPDESDFTREKKAFDTLRGILPMATLGQVAFRGNGQALEHLINRTRKHPLGEFRWFSYTIEQELNTEIPSLLLRVNSEQAEEYQKYLTERRFRVRDAAKAFGLWHPLVAIVEYASRPEVRLVEVDPFLEEKIITAMLFSLPGQENSWETLRNDVRAMSVEQKKVVLAAHFEGRTHRWQKVGRAFENAYMRFEITMNAGAYRDLQRHRAQSQERQDFTIVHGYDTPLEVIESGLRSLFEGAMESVVPLFRELQRRSTDLAQYVVPLASRVRFYQLQDVRQYFWEEELRSSEQGHPDYRFIEQEKHRLFSKVAPLIAPYVKADMNAYPFARRGQEQRMAAREGRILKGLGEKTTS